MCSALGYGRPGPPSLPPSSVHVFPDCLRVCLGVNLLVGTENGLMLLDRSGQGKVYNLITRRRFLQMDVLEGLNVLVTISGQPQVLLDVHRIQGVLLQLSFRPFQGRRTSCVFIICRG